MTRTFLSLIVLVSLAGCAGSSIPYDPQNNEFN